jgi:hypothetical protein
VSLATQHFRRDIVRRSAYRPWEFKNRADIEESIGTDKKKKELHRSSTKSRQVKRGVGKKGSIDSLQGKKTGSEDSEL